MKVVGIGGGTGLPVLLRGLKSLIEEEGESLDITAIVAVSDSGGSSGGLRRALEMPAVGDIRNCLAALAEPDSMLAAVCQHRFDDVDRLAGHTVGNLILSALYRMSGDFSSAIQHASALLGLRERVLPVTDVSVTLCGEYDDGLRVDGEAGFTNNATVRRVWLNPSSPMPSAGVLDALEDADAIVLGPGSLYTSIVPNLLVGGVGRAIHDSRAIKVYVCNLMTEPGETTGFSAAGHLRALQSYLPPRTIDVCVVNNTPIGRELANRYSEFGSTPVQSSIEEIRRLGVFPAPAPLVKGEEVKARHNPDILSRVVISLTRGFGAEHERSECKPDRAKQSSEEVVCGQGKGR